MRRIVPILVSIVSFYSINSFAMSWSEAEPDCRGGNSIPGKVCGSARKIFCGSASGDCEKKGPSVGQVAQLQMVCDGAFTEASKACSGDLTKGKYKLPTYDPNAGTKQTCDQMKQGTETATAANEEAASQCRAAVAICKVRCSDALKSLGVSPSGALPAAFGGGASAAGDPQAIANGYLSQCEGLKGKFAVVAETALKTDTNATLVAAGCQKESESDPKNPKGDGDGTGKKEATDATKKPSAGSGGMPFNPQSLMQMMQAMNQNQNQEDQTEPEQPAIQDCSSNSNIAGCMQTASLPQSWNQATGETSTSSTDDSGGQFNPADASNGMQTASLGDQQQQFGTPATTSAVPNGGGQMLGGGGGGPASLGGAQPASYGGNPSKKVEVQTGGGGGGYSQTAANMNMKNGEGGGGYTYGGRNPAGNDSNFDLSSFLPGGKHDPFKGRNVAGSASGTGNFQIQSKDVNLFSRISERIKSRCAQGLLRDCIP